MSTIQLVRYETRKIIETQVKDGDKFGKITNVGGNDYIERVVIKIKSEEIGDKKLRL